jgi:DNA-binding TFAR19-related protein (PDSD5 family)
MDEQNNDKDSHELDKIRMKKMQALMEAQRRQQASQERVYSINEKLDYILKVVLNPDAYTHLVKLRNDEPNVYQYIYNELISQDVIMNIDYLIAIINQQGGVPRRIPLDIIILLERKAKGIKSKISVKKGDCEVMDLGSYLTK